VSHLSCEPDVLHYLDSKSLHLEHTTLLGGSRPVTIQTFQLDPAGQRLLQAAACQQQSIKLEPGVTQPLPPHVNQPLKLEIQETFLDTGN
jgi:hypothetical protein